MPKPIAFLVFLVIEIVLYPITMLGGILFTVVLLLGIRGKNISATAYELLFARWILDALGKREDKATRQLFYTLPGMAPFPIAVTFLPTMWLMRVLDITIKMYDYPVYSSSSMFSVHGHRTTFFDEALFRYLDRVEQVVILGAGWDTRAYEIARREGVRVFEVDTASMQTQKRKSLEQADVDTSGAVFCAADFDKESWLDALKRVDFDPDKPTFVLWEGVTYYLQAETVEATLQTVAKQLAEGSAIAFDYFARHFIEGDVSLLLRLGLLTFKLFGEPLTFGISTDAPAKEQLAALVEQNGLTLAEFAPIGKGDKKQRLDGGFALAVNE